MIEEFVAKQEEKKAEKRTEGFWGRMWSKNKTKKPQMVAVIYLRKNNIAEPMVLETKKGFFEIHTRTYHIERDCIYSIGKDRTPLAIIEEEGLKPIGNAEFYSRLAQVRGTERVVAEFQNLALNAIRHAELVKLAGEDGAPKFDKKYLLIVGGLLIVGYIIGKQMGWFG